MVVDDKGNIYVVGSTHESFDGNSYDGGLDFFLAKFDLNGNKIWTKQFGTANDVNAYEIAFGGEDNLLVAGSSLEGFAGNNALGSGDALLVGFNLDGEITWVQQFGTEDRDSAHALAVNQEREIYVAGATHGLLDGDEPHGEEDMFLSMRSAEGTELWTRQLGTSEDDAGWSVDIDGKRNIYVVGNTKAGIDGNVSAGAGGTDIFVTKYSPEGVKQWTKQFGSIANDRVDRVRVDHEDVVHVVGYTMGVLDGNTSNGSTDAVLAKFAADGTLVELTQFGSEHSDMAHDLEFGASGEMYLAGHSFGNLYGLSADGESDTFVSRYGAKGNVEWTALLGGGGSEFGYELALSDAGRIYVAGRTTGMLTDQPSSGAGDLFVAHICEED